MAGKMKLLGILFFPLVALYTLAVYLRNRLYDWGILPQCQLEIRAISVGNIQIGGTGKTPFTEYLAKLLLKEGKQVAILTRGYRRKSRELLVVDKTNRSQVTPEQIGDEPYLLLHNLPEVILGVGTDRCQVAEKILQRYPEAVFLLDDGFQHRRLPRQLDVVLIDPNRWSRWPWLFPLTTFRDVKSSLQRAGLVVLTRAKLQPETTRRVKRWLRKRLNCPIVQAEIVPRKLVAIDGNTQLPLTDLAGKRVAAFSGLANPKQFFLTLKEIGARLVYTREFSDHHHYRAEELEEFVRQASKRGAELFVTTQKDAVKINTLSGENLDSLFYLTIQVEITNGDELFQNALARVVRD